MQSTPACNAIAMNARSVSSSCAKEAIAIDPLLLSAQRHSVYLRWYAASSSSSRPYHGLPEITYPLHDREVLVTACGRICMHRKRVNISGVLAGQKLGIKEVDDGIWLVSFLDYDLGYIDLEQKTLQPLDNPFGPRLSPMS